MTLPSCFYGCRGRARTRGMPLFFETFARHTEIDDGEQCEDKRLDAADEEDVERLPEDEQSLHDRGQHHAEGASRQARWHQARHVADQQAEQVDHQGSGKDVAEQPQRQRHRFDDLLDDVERNEEDPNRQRHLEGLGEASKVAAHPEHPQAVGLDHDDDDQRDREGLIQVGVRRVDGPGQRKEIEPVGDEDVEADRHRERHDEGSALAHRLPDQPPHVVDQELEEQLELARDTVAQAVGNHESDQQRDHDRDRAGDQAVVVEGAVPGAANAYRRMGAGWGLGQEDHPESASLTANPASTSWAIAIPPTTSQTCERPISNPIPSPSPVRSSSRTRLTAVKPMPSASERWTITPFALPTSRPIANASPLLSCPVAIPNATTPMATRLETATVLRIRRLLTGIV